MKSKIYTALNYIIALIWFSNGLFCKVFKLVPRHEVIVTRILGFEYSSEITILIGFSEIIMSFWIISKFKSKLNVILQITIISTMNVLEYFLAPDLLLWGKFNALFAFLLTIIIYANEFFLKPKLDK
jgi:DoxX-like family